MIEVVDSFVEILIKQSTLVVLLTALILPVSYFLRNSYPGILLALWILIPLRLVLPTDFAFSYSFAEFFTQTLPVSTLESYAPYFGAEVDLHKMKHFAQPLEQPSNFMNIALFFLWLVGFLYFALRYQMAHSKLARDLSNAHEITGTHTLSLLKMLKGKVDCKRDVKILVSKSFDVSFTTGIIRSYICIPEEVYKTSGETELAAIVSHELIHIKSYDNLLLNMLNILQCVFFFHPSIWLAKKRIIDHRECLTDLSVVKHGILPNTAYAKLLLKNIVITKNTSFQTVTGLGSDFFAMKKRITGIQKSADFNKHSYKFISGIFFVLTFTLIIPMQPVTGSNLYHDISDINFQNPVPSGGCRMKADFGPIYHHSNKQKTFHNGHDIEAPSGAVVVAAANGRIVQIQEPTFRKNGYVVVQHTADLFSRYVFVKNLTVKKNDFVSAGTPLGTIDSRKHGQEEGHGELHFELIKDYEPIDPFKYIRSD